MDWMNLDLEPVPWSMSFDDGDNDDVEGTSKEASLPLWQWEGEKREIDATEAIVSTTGLTKAFLNAFFPQRSLLASITLEKVQKLSLIDSSVGGIEETKTEVVGKVFQLDQAKKLSIEFETRVDPDRAFEITKLIFRSIEIPHYTILTELEALNYISSDPSERSVAPLLRMLSTQPQEAPVCKSLEAPNIVDGIPAAFLSFGVFHNKRIDVFLSLVDGYQIKEETLKVFERIFPGCAEQEDKVYQEILNRMMRVQSNNPLYM